MKRIELTIPDEEASAVLAAIAGFKIATLAVTTLDNDNRLAGDIADWVEREGKRLQAAGRRMSEVTGKELADGIREGAYDARLYGGAGGQVLLDHVAHGGGGGGGRGDAQ